MPNKKRVEKSSSTVTPEVLKELIKRLKNSVSLKTSGPTNSCWYSRLKVNGRGHVQIKYLGIKYLGHRIMACSKSKPYTYVTYDPSTKIEVSHICGDSKCINPDHLIFENCLVNQTRDCCRMFGQKTDYKCPHEPTCIGCQPINKE